MDPLLPEFFRILDSRVHILETVEAQSGEGVDGADDVGVGKNFIIESRRSDHADELVQRLDGLKRGNRF